MSEYKYILEGKTPKPCSDLYKWAMWMEVRGNSRVKYVKLPGGIEVSTVFLGIFIASPFEPEGKPILFETMIFGGEHDMYRRQYATWDEAEKGHDDAVKLATTKLN